ncbi:MAG: nucleotidyltransferase family protein [Deltaproteobacteria bacterium]|nr:nucleotidyltransferase family protein [Deltaproteobacteria bacterium]
MTDPGIARVLVLAGRRAGEGEMGLPTATKALVEVDGTPMIERVLACLREAVGTRPTFVSAGDAALLEATPVLRAWVAEGWLRHHASAGSPAASVHDFLVRESGGGAVLVTTADHPLLTPAMVRHFLGAADATGADVAVAVVEASLFRARFPRVRRTFIPLGDDAVTGANLFCFRTPRAAEAARFWVRAEVVRKRPWRMAALFGPVTLARFALGRLPLDAAVARVSAAMGVRAAAIRMPFAECAIDVDGAADLEAAARVLAARRTAS